MGTLHILGYEKLETLYENCMTYICRAQNKKGETYLIKAMKDDHPTIEQLARFEYEYTLLTELDILGSIRIRNLVKNYKGHIMVMEDSGAFPLLDAPIFKNIQQGDRQLSKDNLQFIIGIFIEMAKVIGGLHDYNLIHKDINPANFLLLPDFKQVNILDFGLATKLEYFENEIRHDKLMESALPYISPEQTGRMARTIDYRTDFYSLGISMYELITGQKPFTAIDPLELIHYHIAEEPVPPHVLNPDIPMTVSSIILKLMEKVPEQRYQSAAGLTYDLVKCLDGLRTADAIENFEIGMNDVSSNFQIPQKLYGRDGEREKLEQVYDQAADGAVRMLLVGGNSGVGKTSVIQEICRPIAEFGGAFVSGKAEQFKDSPYFVFAQAIKELVGRLLQEPDSLLKQWKEQLEGALNDNGVLIINVVPELAAIIGPQPQVNELGPAENRNRLLYTFGNFFKVFARKNYPLTLFLDDFHWCDQPSVELIKYLLSRDDLEGLVMICSYRNNELTEGHPLYVLFEELQKSDKTVMLPVKPLEEEHVVVMLADMLHQTVDRVRSLAGVVYKKTQGNPFFVKKLLLYLYDQHYIRFNGTTRQWEWIAKEIESIGVSDNIVDFIISQILKLQPETQDILKLAALVGSSFDLKILSAIMNIPAHKVVERLREAVDGEIILLNGSEYVIAETLQTSEHNMSFRFVHDRVQQACTALMDKDQQKELHLQIGRIIKKSMRKDDWMNHAMDIVCHLNEGLEAIENDAERWETARLNLGACLKAKASSAFYPALKYIENSVRLLPENAWTQDYEFTFAIIKNYAECAYLNNEYELAEEQSQHLLRQARTSMDQAEIRLMQSTLCNFQGRLDKAIDYAFLGLQLLKMHVPTAPGMLSLVKEMIAVKVGLLNKNKEDLLNLPPMRNEKIKISLQLLNEINRAAYLCGKTNLFILSILKRMQMTLKFGNYHEAGTTYVAYAMILAILGDFQGTYEFCELALQSHEKEQSFECRPTTLFSCGFFGHAWNRSWRDIEKWFEKSMEEAVKYGDQHTIALAGSFMYAFKPDASIRILVKKAMKQFPLIRQTNNRLSFNFTFLMIHRWLNYAGQTDGQFTMSVSQETYEANGGTGIVFSEEECLDALREGNYLSAFGVYFKEKTYIHYFYDDFSGAMNYLKESDKYLNHHTGTPYIVECRMCNFLVLAANFPAMAKKEAEKAKKRMRMEYSHVKSWAKHCPDNFGHLQYIMEAELAVLAHKPYEAADLYDRAIQKARQNGFMRDEALSNELAAKMLIEQGKERQAAFYMTEALKLYRLWGADAKVNHMTEKYGFLLKMAENHEVRLETATATENLDLMSIVKASSAVSKETQLPNLLRQIMKTVIENSGAQKAYILLKSEQDWRIEAERLPGAEVPEVLQSIPLEDGNGLLPSSVINFCIHTGEPVVLGDALNTSRFRKDPYILQNQIRSILCMPILNQGKQEGILYLENNLSADVFTKERVYILQLLASQFSTSIKNFRLFTDLLAKTEEVHQAAEEVLRSDIAFLYAQIKPHFLYNAINTISAYSLDDSQKARDLLAMLSQYLRGSFDFKNRDKLVSLGKELELVEAYLFIEKARFGDRLKIIYNIDESVDCLLPPLIIQPLVENAVQHGLSERKKGGTVEIAVHNENDYVIITVDDDGVGIDETLCTKLFEGHTIEGGGVALKNIHQRLIRTYGHGMEIERKATGGTRATIRITK